MRTSDFPTPKRRLTPVGSIKFYCRYLCCANDTTSWKHCKATKCTLYPYRLGKRPKDTIRPIKHHEKDLDSSMILKNSSDFKTDKIEVKEQ